MPWYVGFSVAPALVVLVAIVARSIVASRRRRRLLATGLAARGTILAIDQTGASEDEQPVVRMRIRVEPERDAAFEVVIRQVIQLVQIPQFQPGKIVTVRYDPQDRTRAAIEALGFVTITAAEGMRMAREAQDLFFRLNQTGTSAKAIVTKFSPTGIVVNGNNPLAELEVKVLAQPPFDAVLRGTFAEAGLHKYQPGKEINIVYDPAEPRVVVLDKSTIELSSG